MAHQNPVHESGLVYAWRMSPELEKVLCIRVTVKPSVLELALCATVGKPCMTGYRCEGIDRVLIMSLIA